MMTSIAEMMNPVPRAGFITQNPMSFSQALAVQRMHTESNSRHARQQILGRMRRAQEHVRIAKLTPAELQAELDAAEAKLLQDIRRWGSD